MVNYYFGGQQRVTDIKGIIISAHSRDEFVILITEFKEGEEGAYLKRLYHNVERIIEKNANPYHLSISTGISEKKGIVISYEAEDASDIPFDSKRIAQVIDNLIGNAIKFSPIGSEIKVKSFRHGEMVSVSISDTGAGIPDEELSKLFNEFQPLSVKPIMKKALVLGYQ